jgi:hypothetical protein
MLCFNLAYPGYESHDFRRGYFDIMIMLIRMDYSQFLNNGSTLKQKWWFSQVLSFKYFQLNKF